MILCGLVTSTALNMLVVPALYLRFGSMRAVLSAATCERAGNLRASGSR